MNYYEQLVGGRIRTRRDELGLSQEQLGQKIGADQSRVSRWEKAHSLPDKEYRKELLRVLGFTEIQLFGIAPPAAPPTTISDMTPTELEALVARASKRDGTINLEVERLRKKLEPIQEIADSWKDQPPAIRAACLFFVTRDKSLVSFLPGKIQLALSGVLRLLQSEKTKESP